MNWSLISFVASVAATSICVGVLCAQPGRGAFLRLRLAAIGALGLLVFAFATLMLGLIR